MKRWIPVLFYIAAVLLFSAQPESSATNMNSWLHRFLPNLSRSEIRDVVFLLRKATHVAAYGVAALLFFYAVIGTRWLRRFPFFWAGVFAFATAGLDEWYQSTLPHRTGTFSDVLIDGIGIVGMLAALYFVDIRRKRSVGSETFKGSEKEPSSTD